MTLHSTPTIWWGCSAEDSNNANLLGCKCNSRLSSWPAELHSCSRCLSFNARPHEASSLTRKDTCRVSTRDVQAAME